jgi:hypothetical protein
VNDRQKTKLKNLIVADCELRYKYTDGEGKCCVVGSMALAAGVSKSALLKSGKQIVSICSWAKKVCKEFGLTMEELVMLQTINDDCETVKGRRTRLLQSIGAE